VSEEEEKVEENEHLVISCTVQDQDNKIRFYAHIDNNATRITFVNENFVCCHQLSLYKLKTSRDLNMFDETSTKAEDITHMIKFKLLIDKHKKYVLAFITKLDRYLIVLENYSLMHHDINISFAANTITFDSLFCLKHCCSILATVKEISTIISKNIALVSKSTFSRVASSHKLRRRHKVQLLERFTISNIKLALKHYNSPPNSDISTLDDDKIKNHVLEKY
jgi:hypothetical protein